MLAHDDGEIGERLQNAAHATTTARVKSHFAAVVQGEVVRYELPNLSALNFVMDQALGGGVTRSLVLDAHGKSLSSALLDLDIVTAPDGK